MQAIYVGNNERPRCRSARKLFAIVIVERTMRRYWLTPLRSEERPVPSRNQVGVQLKLMRL